MLKKAAAGAFPAWGRGAVRLRSACKEVFNCATLFRRWLSGEGGNSIGKSAVHGRTLPLSWIPRIVVKLEALPISVAISSRAR